MPTIIKIISKYIYLNCYFSTLPMFMMEMEVFMNIQMTLGQQVRALRRQRRLTHEQLAELAGVSLQHIGEIERGQGNPTLNSLVKLSDALDISLSELFENSEQYKSEKEMRDLLHQLVEQSSEPGLKQLLSIARCMN